MSNLHPYEVEIMRTAAKLLCEDHAELTEKINTITENRTRPLGKRLSDGFWAFVGAGADAGMGWS